MFFDFWMEKRTFIFDCRLDKINKGLYNLGIFM